MKLGEALSERANLQRRIGELRARVAANANHQEGESVAEDPVVLLDELMKTHEALATLIAHINMTNSISKLEDGTILTHALAQREHYAGLIKTFQGAATAATVSTGSFRYTRSELQTVRDLDVKGLNSQADRASAHLRKLDNEIQAVNWTVELV